MTKNHKNRLDNRYNTDNRNRISIFKILREQKKLNRDRNRNKKIDKIYQTIQEEGI